MESDFMAEVSADHHRSPAEPEGGDDGPLRPGGGKKHQNNHDYDMDYYSLFSIIIIMY